MTSSLSDGTVAFVSSERELRALDELGGIEQFVALSAEADWALERSGRAYVTIEDLYEEDVLLERGGENIERATAFVGVFDRIAAEVFGDLATETGLSARHHLYHLKILFDALFHRSYTIGCALDELRPARVALVAPPALKQCDGFEFPPQALSGFVLPRLAAVRGIEVAEAPAMATERLGPRRRLSTQRQRARRLARFGRRRMHSRQPAQGARLLVVTVDQGSTLIEECVARGVEVVRLHEVAGMLRNRHLERSLRRRASELWRRLLTDPEVAELLRFDGADLMPVAAFPLAHFVEQVLPRELAATREAEKMLAALRISAVVSTFPASSPESIATFVAAGRLGLPTVALQHGGFVGYYDFPMLEYVDLNLASTTFCFGAGVERYARSLAERSKSPHRMNVVPVGSSALDAVGRSGKPLPSGSRNVVYALANLAGDGRYFSWHQYPDIWHWRAEREVIDICAATPGVRLLVKLHPAPDPTSPLEAWIRARHGETVQIVRETPFLDAIEDADLVVIDTPSTTLLQALVARKPIVVYGDERFLHPDRQALAPLESAVRYAHDRKTFLAQLRAALMGDVGPPGPSAELFLREYATCQNDGLSTHRAVEALLALASRRD